MPISSNSSSIQPIPTPSSTRLPERTAAVPTCLATWTGIRAGRMYTVVRKRSRCVTAARWPIVTQGSGHGVPIPQRRLPSRVYG